MNNEQIGLWAGSVWSALNEADALGLKQLKKISKLKDKEVYAAIGWLAREGKIVINENPEDDKDYIFSLAR
ncbi:MAG: winged helix-turn-helix domain-containing protein [Muribaculaceae bacterium]|nr:winged helix-turn-helix domain-containing protein [Muribaculaceae bacterium]MDE6352186.1 winged helix-turn-helix domain-containing protein [Muribaculaceae bacterium]MDE6642788.1 winged helix-turn-helix domain-containing protein [Muribaculaceae bacterium]